MRRVPLKKTLAYTYRKNLKYLARYDHASGRKDRYELTILTSDDPIVIGRELPLQDVRRVIAEHEAAASAFVWFGDRRTALRIVRKVQEARR